MSKYSFTKAAISVLLVTLGIAGAPVSAQRHSRKPADHQQDKAVKLSSDLIQLRAVVTDKKGNPVDDLKKEDFHTAAGTQTWPLSGPNRR